MAGACSNVVCGDFEHCELVNGAATCICNSGFHKENAYGEGERLSRFEVTKKVADGIRESQIIIPILTKNSISSQWVNQEIGFAVAKDIKEIEII